MSKSNAQVGVLAVLGLLVAGVVGAAIWRAKHPPIGGNLPIPTFAAEQDATPVEIDVYVDGSGSIRNFLQPTVPRKNGRSPIDGPNYFQDFLNKCNVALNHAHPQGAPRYWMFGGGDPVELGKDEPLHKLGVTTLHDLSEHPEAFHEPTTRIETAVAFHPKPQADEGPPGSLKLIVSDLYQSGGDQGIPANALANTYLQSSPDAAVSGADAVAVLAVRNPYYGAVEDLPGTPEGGSLPGAADTMPFYIVVAGPAAAVRLCVNVLVEETGLEDAIAKNKAAEFFFSRRMGGRMPSPDDPSAHFKGKHFTETKNYNKSEFSLVEVPDGVPLSVRWKRGAPGATGGGDAPVPAVGVAQPDRIAVSARTVDANRRVVEDAKAAAAFGNCEAAGMSCTLDGHLPRRDPYLFEFDLISKRSDSLQPNAVCDAAAKACLRDWNIEHDPARYVSGTTKVFPRDARIADSEHPGKTPDLSKFLVALQGKMFDDKVRLATDYLYVQAR